MSDTISSGEPQRRPAGHGISFLEAFKVWLRVAALSFGGPAGQIAVMHRIVVDEKKWVGEGRFLHALNYCMLLPGPEAQQLAVYLGWLLHRTAGGLMAGILFILPGFLSILALSYVYVVYGDVAAISGLFFGLKAAVLAIVLQAVIRIGGRALKGPAMAVIAATAFIAIFAFQVPFPLIILVAAVVGYVGTRAGSSLFAAAGGHKSAAGSILSDADSALGDGMPAHARPNLQWSLRVSVILLLLWLAPVALLYVTLGPDNVFTQIGVFFSKMAVVTFGGAYAVLAYVAQEAVQNYQWLRPGEMLDGLGMAETTPGPLIMVLQFVGFLGAYRDAGSLGALQAATIGAILATWVTFVPCFLWIFLGAPFIERLRGNTAISGGMAAITAAVVGVILNLAIWFGLHVLFSEVIVVRAGPLSIEIPVLSSIDRASLTLTLLAVFAIFRLKMSVMTVLLSSAVLGMAGTLVGMR
jgi:chromate transporter